MDAAPLVEHVGRMQPVRIVGARRREVAAVLALLVASACAELTPDPPRGDVTGCYRLTLPEPDEVRAPAPPAGLELTDRALLAEDASAWQIEHHRFDARRAKEAFFVYPDTALRVAWWWEAEDERRFGVGNKNQAAAFYIDGVVRGDRFEGELRRWLYDEEGRPVEGLDSWTAPVTGRRAGCERG